MKYFKKMSAEEFGKYLLTVPFDTTIEFALDYVGPTDEQELPYGIITEEGFDCECWFFIRGVRFEEYCSRFWLCDYAGGEEAFAIPASNYGSYPTMEDKEYVPRFWKQCWERICDWHNQQDYLFVEIIEED